MIKKIVILAGGTLLVGLLLFGRNTISYIRTSVGSVRETVQNSVPVEFQIDHARHLIKDLAPEVRKNMHIIAKEEVELQRIEEQIAAAESRLVKEKDNIMRLKGDVASDKPTFQYAGRSFTLTEVKSDLANRFERYKTSEATLNSLKGIHEARQRSLAAARQKLDGMLAARRQLQVDVENLEARNQMVAAAKTTSSFQFDDSQLGQAKELVAGLRTRLEVDEKMVNAETEFQGEIPMDKATPQNIVEQVGDYFADKTPDTKSVAKK